VKKRSVADSTRYTPHKNVRRAMEVIRTRVKVPHKKKSIGDSALLQNTLFSSFPVEFMAVSALYPQRRIKRN